MNCQTARESFPELLDARTPADSFPEARAHLASCPDCQRDFAALSQTLAALDAVPVGQPSPRLRRDFYSLLEEEKHSAASARETADRVRQSRNRNLWWRWIALPVGAAALLTAGFEMGNKYSAAATAPTLASANEMRQELHELRAKVDHMDAMNQLVAASLQDQQRLPANDRLRGVLTSATENNPSDKVIDELITSLALDPSANVRLRALEALYPHADRELVRAGVLASLPRESNPLVQVAMIDFLAAARDRDAKSALERMSLNVAADQSVRTAAKRALAQL